MNGLRVDIPALTGLRFFAAVLIVFGHGGDGVFFNYAFGPLDPKQGVSLFFVLSGFVLAHAYPELRTKADAFRFLFLRIARLWPAHLFVLTLFVVAFQVPRTAGNFVTLGANASLIQAWFPIIPWWGTYNGVAWSISAELLFYLTFPLTLGLARRHPWALMAVGILWQVLLLAFCVWQDLPDRWSGRMSVEELVYAWPLARLPEFLTGTCAYFIASTRPMREPRPWNADMREMICLASCLAAMIGCTQLAKAAVFPSQVNAWMSTTGPYPAFALLLCALLPGGGIVSRGMSHRWLVFMGKVSFSLYLVHQPIIRAIFELLGEWPRQNTMAAMFVYWVSSIGAAIIIYVLIEEPARRKAKAALAGVEGTVSKVMCGLLGTGATPSR